MQKFVQEILARLGACTYCIVLTRSGYNICLQPKKEKNEWTNDDESADAANAANAANAKDATNAANAKDATNAANATNANGCETIDSG